MSLGMRTLASPPGVRQAQPHIYVAYRVVPRVLADGTLVVDAHDEDGAVAVVALPADLVDELIALSGKKVNILYDP